MVRFSPNAKAFLKKKGVATVVVSFVEFEVANSLIVDNNNTGVFVRADSRHVIRNSTIATPCQLELSSSVLAYLS